MLFVLAVIVGTMVGIWHPWAPSKPPPPSALASAGTWRTWRSAARRYPHLVRRPRWMPGGFTLVSIKTSGGPLILSAEYWLGDKEILITETAGGTHILAPGIHQRKMHGATLQVAAWTPQGTAVHDVLAAFTQGGNTYQANSDAVPLSIVERIVRSLWRTS